MDAVTLGLMIAGAAALSGAGVFLHERSNRRRAERLLAPRPQLDPASFGRAYFGESGPRAALAAQLREILARHVPFTLDGLAADDAFVKDLWMDELDSMSAVEFLLDIEEHFGIKVPDEDAEAIRTFRQLLDYLEHRVGEARPAHVGSGGAG